MCLSFGEPPSGSCLPGLPSHAPAYPTSLCHEAQADLARSPTHSTRPASPATSPPNPTSHLPTASRRGLESTIQPPLLSGHEAQAGPFVLTDKRKKAGWGRRINLSTSACCVRVFPLPPMVSPSLCSYYLLVRVEDIGWRCTVDPQRRDTPLIRPLFCLLPFLSSCCPWPSLTPYPPSLSSSLTSFQSSGFAVS